MTTSEVVERIREAIYANVFDGQRGGEVRMPVERLVDKVIEAVGYAFPVVDGTASDGNELPPCGERGHDPDRHPDVQCLSCVRGDDEHPYTTRPDGVTSEGEEEEEERRFEVGDRVVYDPDAQINAELGGAYTGLGVCTVTALDVEAYGQLLSFTDERGEMHDGWWADRFKAAPTEVTVKDGEGDVTYFVAFRSATGYGYRVLIPRPRIVTAADVIALTDLLARDVGGDVVPLNWIELPPPPPMSTQAGQVAFSTSGSSTEIRSTLAPIRIDRGIHHQVLSGSEPSIGGIPQMHPVPAAASGERPDLPYLPRRAM